MVLQLLAQQNRATLKPGEVDGSVTIDGRVGKGLCIERNMLPRIAADRGERPALREGHLFRPSELALPQLFEILREAVSIYSSVRIAVSKTPRLALH